MSASRQYAYDDVAMSPPSDRAEPTAASDSLHVTFREIVHRRALALAARSGRTAIAQADYEQAKREARLFHAPAPRTDSPPPSLAPADAGR